MAMMLRIEDRVWSEGLREKMNMLGGGCYILGLIPVVRIFVVDDEAIIMIVTSTWRLQRLKSFK